MTHRRLVCRRNIAIAAWGLAIALSALASACGRSSDFMSGESTLRTTIEVQRPNPLMVSDSVHGPQQVSAIVVDVDAVAVHHRDYGWLTLSDDPRRVDLVRTNTHAIATGPTPDGTYDGLRLVVAAAEIEIDGAREALTATNGVHEIPGSFCVGDEWTEPEEIALVWEVESSLRYDTAEGYVLEPRLLSDGSGPCDAQEVAR